MTLSIQFTVNGAERQVQVAPSSTLLEMLREQMLMTGTKEACGVGECGTCVVLVDGEPITSCLVLAADAAGRSIETVEGLADNGELTEVQNAFVNSGAFQCGFCTPGMLMTATALLRHNPDPDEDEIKKALGGVLCRCGAYPKIIEAVTTVAIGEEV